MTDIKNFPILYGIDKNNKIKQWNICVENKGTHSLIVYSYGYVNGRKVECTLSVSSGKNLGKRNQTTHFQQAVADAQSRWTKKRDTDNYRTDQQELLDNAYATATDQPTENNNSSVRLPMLAQDYHKYSKKLQFPCFIQPKLDGYRMIYNPHTKTMTSRTGKSFTVLQGTALDKELCGVDTEFHLDGELYFHNPNFSFENYGVLRKQSYAKLTEAERQVLHCIRYHIYDIIHPNMPFKQRQQTLETLRSRLTDRPHLRIVDTQVCNSRFDIQTYHKSFIENNYEGSILRNGDGVYKQKYRSYDLLKYKDFDDSEFKIVDFTFENDFKGTDEKPILWVCETALGQKFNVQSKGTRTERSDLYGIGGKFIGKMLWVQHFGWTSDGIPRFPKTMRNGRSSIREVE